MAARVLRQRRQLLVSGEGAVFRRMTAEAAELEAFQAALDEQLALQVPEVFKARRILVLWGPG